MYKELKKKDWMRELKLKEKDIPDGLILLGNQSAHRYYEQWKKKLKHPRVVQEHMILGDYHGLKIAFAVVYGPTLASEFIHVLGMLGTPVVVQTGSFGGLKKGLRVGDIFVPKEAVRGEAVSDWYVPKNQACDASKDLVNFVLGECRQSGLRCHTGKIFTTAAMLAERRSDIQRWSRQGFVGVDLETSATFAVAKHFKMKRVAILSHADHLIEESHMLSMSKHEHRTWKKSLDNVFDLALKTVGFVKKNG